MSAVVESGSHKRPLLQLTTLFFSWKLFLLAVAAASPGPGYDTSTQLFLPMLTDDDSLASRTIAQLLSKLVRWDALYFMSIAEKGYQFEQEWAFGPGFLQLVGRVAQATPSSLRLPPLLAESLAGVILAHLFHLLAALVLYALTYSIILSTQASRSRSIAFIAASLFIISPAGLFLSAPYNESSFAFFNFLGMLSLSNLQIQRYSLPTTPSECLRIIFAGVCFSVACTIRSNGLLSLLVFAEPILRLLVEIWRRPSHLEAWLKLICIGVAGLLTLATAAFPQFIAYQQYCGHEELRPWCRNMIPSISAFVQEHYWNVGFLRYWTLSNLPLFLLAAPTLAILMATAVISFLESSREPTSGPVRVLPYLRWFALPQIVLTLTALFSFHVQIINRISTGYPAWYIILALAITNNIPGAQPLSTSGVLGVLSTVLTNKTTQQWIVRSMVMYAVIQGGLFASFLPPA